MVRVRSIWLSLVLVVGLLSLMPQSGLTQGEGSACSALVKRALTEVGTNCTKLTRNDACYGFNQVAAQFNQAVADDFFTKPADRAQLVLMNTLNTAPLDEAQKRWGVALMSVQANVPSALPGQAVVFVMLGDTQVKNQVDPQAAFLPVQPLEVKAQENVNLRSGPGTTNNVINTVNAGVTLQADGRSADDAWLRVAHEDSAGWVSREFVSPAGDWKQLPIITEQTRSPMQAFQLTTGLNATQCGQAPDVLVVQGPQKLRVAFTVNGADVQIGSTVALRSLLSTYGKILQDRTLNSIFGAALAGQKLPDETVCRVTYLMVMDGRALLNDGKLVLPRGYMARSINCDDKLVTPWGGARALNADELGELETLNNIPPDLLHYPIRTPKPGEIDQGGGGSSTTNQGACGPLKPTSPLGTMANGYSDFYWDGLPDATSYVVNVYNEGKSPLTQFATGGAETNTGGDVSASAIGAGRVFYWDVEARVNNQTVCRSGLVRVVRDEFEQPQDRPAPAPGQTLSCVARGKCNAPCTIVPSRSCGRVMVLCSCPA